ncbi:MULTISPECIES: GNAT family N-acetyltransferase [Pseudoalteromonas]|uniref:GNAT family acetyltraansferase n=1 Tax=Pseudoalteromonas ruthenica TaxID=151081 RepID=A0A0F4PWU1_9GAMM|nr:MULTISPECIES: GNAT family N-acetyltransferase [Pseudoalteromonas]KJY99065.1 GNAT family acetyltraansferase [Pseudoalteromonas ruthenica]KJY99892.1 GNAT family acetyltraansferase [Pseudoalteromonas ruthenica]MCF2861682.1 GNAT family N-acetyltransferase [Pseudoalteromonas sp. CNAT2-18]MCG7544674.1 GNAT family N-acetyltransferase [Pseudoalteromonas sp. MM17-2]MCG7557280.1 GNAT family N-acetyltransferase [Pseudoalteromonas sp. CNAT2-18.1]|tara:strand:- start:1734 stop:2192 length:459 start_codon:yes stop_codon:yes gene_type:complete
MSYQIHQVDWGSQDNPIRQIRERVFVCELNIPKAIEFDGRDTTALHFIAYADNGEPVATARLCKDGLLGRIAVLPPHRNRGIYSQMLTFILSNAASNGLESICINCLLDEVERFKNKGFSPCGCVFMEAGIPRQRLQCPIAQCDSSPFTMVH